MEDQIPIPNNYIEIPLAFKCEKCDKVYKRKSSLARHTTTKHEQNKVLKLKLKNEFLELKINLYVDQIKFLKRLILVQELTIRTSERHPIRLSDYISMYGPNPNNVDQPSLSINPDHH